MLTNKKALSIILFATLSSSELFSLTVNGNDIRNIVHPGETLRINAKDSTTHIAFEHHNGELIVGTSDKAPIRQVRNRKKELDRALATSSFTGKSMTIACADSDIQGRRLTAREKLTIGQKGGTVSITSCIIEAPKALFIGKTIDLVECFANKTPEVIIYSADKDAFFEYIIVTFSKNPKVPPMIEAHLDMESGSMDGPFVAFGAKRITIKFNDELLK